VRDLAAARSFAVSGGIGDICDDAAECEPAALCDVDLAPPAAAATFMEPMTGSAAMMPAEKIQQLSRCCNFTRLPSVTVADPSVARV
jgi:hypothetical protein